MTCAATTDYVDGVKREHVYVQAITPAGELQSQMACRHVCVWWPAWLLQYIPAHWYCVRCGAWWGDPC